MLSCATLPGQLSEVLSGFPSITHTRDVLSMPHLWTTYAWLLVIAGVLLLVGSLWKPLVPVMGAKRPREALAWGVVAVIIGWSHIQRSEGWDQVAMVIAFGTALLTVLVTAVRLQRLAAVLHP